jgi:hypothetical protein
LILGAVVHQEDLILIPELGQKAVHTAAQGFFSVIHRDND